MANTENITKLSYGFLAGNLWGSESKDDYDVDASVRSYANRLTLAFEDAMPNAEVRIDWQDGAGALPRSLLAELETDDGDRIAASDDIEFGEYLDRIAGEVWASGAWMILRDGEAE